MDLLVTGGAGYIGSVTVAHLLRAGHRVTVLDDLSRGWRQAVSPGVELIVAEMSDRIALESLFRKRRYDAVLHFAALIEAGESMQAPERYFRNNTDNTLLLQETMLAHNVDRLVFSSTAAVYGDPARTPIEESDPLLPTNVYGETKLKAEQAMEEALRSRGLRFASLRYFNAAGASGDLGENHRPETHLIPLALSVALGKRANVSIFGTDYPTPDGTCVRDYIHVDDLASAHLLALDALEMAGHLIYNLGNGTGFSVRQVIEVVRRVTGHAIPAIECPRRPGDPAVLVASSAKIARELGWHAKHSRLEDIVRSAWDWLRSHPDGYAN